MPQRVELLGSRFGSLVCIKEANRKVAGSVVWVCQCDCGRTEDVAAYRLTSTRKRCQKTMCNECSSKRRSLDLAGQKFSEFEVLSREEGRLNGLIVWKCKCSCGNVEVISTGALTQGKRKRCKTCAANLKLKVSTKHSMSYTPTYKSWSEMIVRCYCETNSSYPRYGGRGIKVCDRWRESFQNFFEDMGERPENKTLDRIDNSGNYEPGNCKWSTAQEQALNRRSSVILTYKGKTQNLSQWAKELGFSDETLRSRIKRGWSTEQVFETLPLRRGT